MSRPDEPRVELVRIGSAGARRRAWLAAGWMTTALAAIIAVGAFGGGDRSPVDAAPTARTAERASRDATTPGPSGAARSGRVASEPRTVSVPRFGYKVTYQRDPAHRPVILDRGALAIFGYGERVPNGIYPGTVHVAVGTPARGASILGDEAFRRVYGETLDDLVGDYLDAVRMPAVSSRVAAVGGAPARLLEFADGRWVALLAHGNRSYVLTATGFDRVFPDAVRPARKGLEFFLLQFHLTDRLFVSRQLGFEAPLPGPEQPFGAVREYDHASGEGDGFLVFPGGRMSAPGTWLHAIGVSVGSEAHPARVEVLPGGVATPQPARIWADSLVGLQSAYLEAIGGRRGSSATIRIAGELALLVERPNGLAAAVLAARRGRVYIISTTGSRVAEPAPGFGDFIEGFEFLG